MSQLPMVIHPKLRMGQRRRLRRILRARDGDLCCWCRKLLPFGQFGHTPLTPTIEHLVPLRIGGSNDLSNLFLAHYWCNTSRDQGLFGVPYRPSRGKQT